MNANINNNIEEVHTDDDEVFVRGRGRRFSGGRVVPGPSAGVARQETWGGRYDYLEAALEPDNLFSLSAIAGPGTPSVGSGVGAGAGNPLPVLEAEADAEPVPVPAAGAGAAVGAAPLARSGPARGNPSRSYMFTVHVQSDTEWTPALAEGFRYLVAQLEVAPTTGQLHWQGYVELARPMRIPQVKGLLGRGDAHLEVRRGTQAQAIAYCSKADTRAHADAEPTVLGAPSGGQGERTDISGAVATLKDGKGLLAVLEAAPETFVRYHRGLTAAHDLYTEQSSQMIRAELRVTVLVGPPGCGKTRAVYDECGLSSVYTLTQTSGTVWWNGYTGQTVLLLDDYYGWITWGELLKLLDIYPLRVQTKGGFTHVRYTSVFITSNRPWDHWYAKSRAFEEMGALQRRIHTVRTYSAEGTFSTAPPAQSASPPAVHPSFNPGN